MSYAAPHERGTRGPGPAAARGGRCGPAGLPLAGGAREVRRSGRYGAADRRRGTDERRQEPGGRALLLADPRVVGEERGVPAGVGAARGELRDRRRDRADAASPGGRVRPGPRAHGPARRRPHAVGHLRRRAGLPLGGGPADAGRLGASRRRPRRRTGIAPGWRRRGGRRACRPPRVPSYALPPLRQSPVHRLGALAQQQVVGAAEGA